MSSFDDVEIDRPCASQFTIVQDHPRAKIKRGPSLERWSEQLKAGARDVVVQTEVKDYMRYVAFLIYAKTLNTTLVPKSRCTGID